MNANEQLCVIILRKSRTQPEMFPKDIPEIVFFYLKEKEVIKAEMT